MRQNTLASFVAPIAVGGQEPPTAIKINKALAAPLIPE